MNLPVADRAFLVPKLCIQQRVLTDYRGFFFDRLADRLGGQVEVFAGEPLPEEGIHSLDRLEVAGTCRGRNFHFGRGPFYACWQRGVVAWFWEHRPDVLVLEANARILSNFPLIRNARKTGCPIVGWGLGMLDWRGPRWVQRPRRRLLTNFLGRFDALIAYSQKAASDYRSLGFPAERIFVATNAVAGNGAMGSSPPNGAVGETPLEWKTKPIVLYVGRLVPGKRVGDLIEACGPLQDSVELIIVGDGPERGSLEEQAHRLHLRAKFTGHLTGERLAQCFSTADLFVLPGAGGLALQEAMSYGKAIVVASGDGSQEDLVREGENGFRIAPGDVFGLQRRIMECLSAPSRVREMGRRSLQIIREGFNLESMTDGFLQAVRFVLVSKGSPVAVQAGHGIAE